MQAPLGPITLTGKHIQLAPLRLEHLPALLEAGRDEEVSRYLPHRLDDPAAMRARVEAALEAQAAGREFPFAVVARESERIAGCTSYLDVSDPNRSLEIGWTWYARDVWGTAVNPEAKFLLLRHAFEEWAALRVFFKTDSRNKHSQAAILKLGARYEGTLRSHMLLADGYRRDSMYYSILDSEWPEVKAKLEQRLSNAEGSGIQ